MRSHVLSQIAEKVASRLQERKRSVSLSELRDSPFTYKPKDFTAAFPKGDVNVIAEVKRASPSQADIALALDPVAVAGDYLQNGAKALSVLTERDFFQGDIDYLRRIRKRYPDARLLMKDFFVDEYQLYEARLAGADAVLIIMALLGFEASSHLYRKATALGLTPLVEVHDEPELNEALAMGARLIGVNNRNLKTLEIDLKTSFDLARHITPERIFISESGIDKQDTVTRLHGAGYRGFLIGTSFMRTGKPGEALARMLKGTRDRHES